MQKLWIRQKNKCSLERDKLKKLYTIESQDFSLSDNVLKRLTRYLLTCFLSFFFVSKTLF